MTNQIPFNSILFSLVLTVLLALINLGSITAFNSIVGLLTGSGGVSYAISIGCVCLKRIRGEQLPPSNFSLGRFGIVINAFACLYMVFGSIIGFFPLFAHVTLETMNWSSVMFAGAALIAFLYYTLIGKDVYEGPVVYLQSLEEHSSSRGRMD